MHSKTQEIEENKTISSSTWYKSSFPPLVIVSITSLRLRKEENKLTTKVETLTQKVQTLQVKLATTSNQNPAQPTASTSKPSHLIKEPVATAPIRRTTFHLPLTPSSPALLLALVPCPALLHFPVVGRQIVDLLHPFSARSRQSLQRYLPPDSMNHYPQNRSYAALSAPCHVLHSFFAPNILIL